MQEELRQRFRNFLESEGVMQKFISNKIAIEGSILSMFKTGRINFTDDQYNKLDSYLVSKGYSKERVGR